MKNVAPGDGIVVVTEIGRKESNIVQIRRWVLPEHYQRI